MRAGIFGNKEKLFAVPWQALKIDEAHKDIMLDVEQEWLKESPGFDRDDWPREADSRFASSVHDYYGMQY